jgi:hypothetical protein
MEQLLPGLTNELAQHGGVTVADVSANIRWFHSGGYHQPGQSGFSGIGVSRPSLEGLVRQRVLALPNVQAVENCNVLGLATTADHSPAWRWTTSPTRSGPRSSPTPKEETMPDGDPREDLRRLIAAKLATAPVHVADPDLVAELVMGLFATVDERWDRVDTTALGAARRSWVRQRSLLVVTVPDLVERWEQDRFDCPPPVRVG